MRYRGLYGTWRSPRASMVLCLAVMFAALCAGLPKRGRATPSLRFQTDLHGDLVVFGNTMSYDCRAGIPDPIVGTVDRNQCFLSPALNMPPFIDDTSSDVFWRSEDSGQVTASANVQIAQARSAAVLQLPPGATVAYARIYWSSTVFEDMSNASSILIDRPGAGGFSQTVEASPADIQAADRSFQGTADITELVQSYGAGVYRISGAVGFPKSQMVDHRDDNNYAAWAVVVLYKRDSEPVRHLAVYDGLTVVSPNNNSSLNLRGFVVPPQGNIDSKLAVIGYEGDNDQTGDSLIFKSTNRLTDGQAGSDANFFNSSRTMIGQPFTVTGDLPQLNGQQGSMSGLDLDVISITPFLSANDTQAQLDMVTGATVGSDLYFVGAVATAIASRKPVIEADLIVPPGLTPLPGDAVEYILTVRNAGDDTASSVVVEQVLPPGLEFVPGSLIVTSGPNQGNKTDAAGDDEAEYDAATRTVRIRLGAGATATKGGELAVGAAPLSVRYELQIGDAAIGAVATQAVVRATPAGQPSAGATPYPSGDGTRINHPTVINVRECMDNFDCTLTAPVCDLRASPHLCTALCASDTDCQGAPGGQDVCGPAQRCVQCSASKTTSCTLDGFGAACLPSGACGCMNDADCGGRTCNTVTNTCPKPSADLSPRIGSDADPADVDHPVTLSISVSNKGPALAPSGARLLIQIPAGGKVQSIQATQGWRCTLDSGAVRCTYFRPISAGATSPDIKIVVMPSLGTQGAGAGGLMVQATVSSSSSMDPISSDDTAVRTIPVGRYRVAGGGLGCNLSPDGTTASLWSAAAVALATLRLLRRRRTTRASNA